LAPAEIVLAGKKNAALAGAHLGEFFKSPMKLEI
jgi:hypothetical protein